ncbi:MAG: 3-oxoacyl-[acyl-carrier-protein] synthase II [Verrucomicrobiales bacterium]|jgi:3-oxoacyl-[acyl-carrier-protein] synthase II
MRPGTVITGVGIVSALSDTPSGLHAALCEGKQAGTTVEKFDDREVSAPGMAVPIADFSATEYVGEKGLSALDRAGRLSVSAAHLALETSGWTSEMRERDELDLVIGTTFCSAHSITQFDRKALLNGPKYAKPLDFANTVINAAGGQTAIRHNLRGANTTVAAGKVSGLRALRHAQIQVEHGLSKVALVGGVEELCFETFEAFALSGHAPRTSTSPIPFQADRAGFILGEGAGFAVIENAESAASRGAKVIGQLLGHGSSYDISRGEDESNAVERCAEAISAALNHAEITAADVKFVSCSANGSPREDRFEALALAKVFGDSLGSIPVTAAVSSGLGETLGASGLFQLAAGLEAARTGQLPGTPGSSDGFDSSLPKLNISESPVEGDFKTGLLLSVGFDGSSAASVMSV